VDRFKWTTPSDRDLGLERVTPGENLKSICHRCYLFEIAFVWELTKETIHLPLGCLQGGDLGLGRGAHVLVEEVGGAAHHLGVVVLRPAAPLEPCDTQSLSALNTSLPRSFAARRPAGTLPSSSPATL